MQVDVAAGVTLHVEELGAGPPVVLLHGLLVGNMASWYFTLAPALAKHRRVVLYDLRGHGLSSRPRAGYDVATMTRDLEAVVDRVAGGRATLVGHSYGAAVALAFALRKPAAVEALVVVEAPLPPSRLEELDAFLATSPEAMLDALPGALRDAVAGGRRRGRRFVEAMRFLATESTLLADLRAAEDVTDDALRALAPPLAAIYGTRSSCRAVGARLARVVPGARVREIDGGHFLPTEAPAALTAAVLELLDA